MKLALYAFATVMAFGALCCVASAILAESGWVWMIWTIAAVANGKMALKVCDLLGKVMHEQDMEEMNARLKAERNK